jgi:hypothetical protein
MEKKNKNHSWLMILILSRGLDDDSKQLFLITFSRICHIKGTLQEIFFSKISKVYYLIFQN